MTSTNTSKSVSTDSHKTSVASYRNFIDKYPYEWGDYPELEKKDRYDKKIHRVTWNPRLTWNFNFDLDDRKIVKNWYLTMNQQEILIQIEWANGGKSMFNANNEQDENVEYECLTPDDDIDPFALEELYTFNDVWELDEIHTIDA